MTQHSASSSTTATPAHSSSASPVAQGYSSTSTSKNWTYPTSVFNEPGYTNGTYKVGATNNVGKLNEYLVTSLYSFLLLDEIYGAPTQLLPNSTISPWLATSWSSHNVTKTDNTTYDPLTGQVVHYNYSWTVHIRPGVQWTDWTPSNAGNQYTYSNYVSFNNTTGAHFTHTYKTFSPIQMKTHYVQAADFILSWKLLHAANDYAGLYQNIVNVVPVNNLTVRYELSNYSATFLTDTLETPILPYHIWQTHDYAALKGAWNYTKSLPSSAAYDKWNLGETSSGYVPGLIGTGPFMMNGGYGMPKGYVQQSQGWRLYVNPHYWTQYASASSGLRQFTPKIYSVNFPYYTSESNAVTAELRGQIDTITQGVAPNFVPTVLTMPNTYIYHKPSSGYAYMQVNSQQSNAPFNITALRQALNYATNKAYLATVVSSGYATLGQPLIPPSDPLWRNSTTPLYTYNPSKAMSLIKSIPGMVNKSGEWYYNGKQVKANIQITSAASNPIGVEGALLIQKWWDSVGISTSVTQEAFTTLLPNLADYGYNTISLGISGIAGDPTGDYQAFYNYNGGYGSGFYLGPFSAITYNGQHMTGKQVNATMNHLTNELNTLTNLSKRIKISKEIQGIGAIESTQITLGYPVDILEFTNTTFTNISTSNTQPYSGYMYWAFMTTHERAKALSTSTSSHLDVSVKSSSNILNDGQYANVTVTVTNNKTGKAVSGADVFLGANPSGAMLNISSDKGKTNSNGQYTWEFSVLGSQSLVYTKGYTGEVNISAAAYESGSTSVGSGIGSTLVNILPKAIQIQASSMPVLTANGGFHEFTVKVMDSSGNALSGFQYTIQSLNGAVMMKPTSSSQSVSHGVSAYVSVNNTHNYNDNNITSISGTTGSNGTIAVLVAANSSFNFAADGSVASSYIFLGSMLSGSPVTGKAGYMLPAEMTSPQNPNGFGVQQPVEFPVEVAQHAPGVSITVKVSKSTTSYNGNVTVTATVTNTTTGKAISGYKVDFTAQNLLGANRGYFTSSSGKLMFANNPNAHFGSQYLPGMQATTNSKGQAVVTFTPMMYSYNATTPSITLDKYSSGAVVPADAFIISVTGANSSSVAPVNYTMLNVNGFTPGTSSPSPLSGNLLYVVIGVVVVAIVAAVAVGATRRRKN